MSYEVALRPHSLELDPPIVGSSPEISALRDLTRRLAASTASILIVGESGSGKELVARNLHSCSGRSSGPFVAVNCAALNPGILESELFGHGRGSFTGAVQAHAGLFEQADGGTLFLDEVGEIPPQMQAKLLRVLQDREIRRMGGSAVRRVDVRVVSATNVDLAAAIARRDFRRDLFYRLNVVEIQVPPLRRRMTDVFELMEFFFRRRRLRLPVIDAGARRMLLDFDWPGNVRELENEIERLVALHPDAGVVTACMLSERVSRRAVRGAFDVDLLYEAPLPEAIGYLEKDRLRKTLEQYKWNKARSARELGLSRQGLLKKIRRYKIEPDRGDEDGGATRV